MRTAVLALLSLSASCSLPAADAESTAAASQQAVKTHREVLFFDHEPVAEVHVTAVGSDHVTLEIVSSVEPVASWIDATLHMNPQHKSGQVVSADEGNIHWARSFTGFLPVDVTVSPGDPHAVRVVVQGKLGTPEATDVDLPPAATPGSGLPTSFRTTCLGLPATCGLVSDVSLAWHGDDAFTTLTFTGSSDQLDFDPTTLGALSVDAVGTQGDLSVRLFSATLATPRVVDAGSIVIKQGQTTRTITFAGALAQQ